MADTHRGELLCRGLEEVVQDPDTERAAASRLDLSSILRGESSPSSSSGHRHELLEVVDCLCLPLMLGLVEIAN